MTRSTGDQIDTHVKLTLIVSWLAWLELHRVHLHHNACLSRDFVTFSTFPSLAIIPISEHLMARWHTLIHSLALKHASTVLLELSTLVIQESCRDYFTILSCPAYTLALHKDQLSSLKGKAACAWTVIHRVEETTKIITLTLAFWKSACQIFCYFANRKERD